MNQRYELVRVNKVILVEDDSSNSVIAKNYENLFAITSNSTFGIGDTLVDMNNDQNPSYYVIENIIRKLRSGDIESERFASNEAVAYVVGAITYIDQSEYEFAYKNSILLKPFLEKGMYDMLLNSFPGIKNHETVVSYPTEYNTCLIVSQILSTIRPIKNYINHTIMSNIDQSCIDEYFDDSDI